MAKSIKKRILEEIEKHDTIILSRHIRPDGDAVGSTLGLAEIIKETYPQKRVFLDNEGRSAEVAFLGDEGERPTDEDYKNALVIVLDCGDADRIANERYNKGEKLIKIDHHLCEEDYGDLSWVEPERSSVCEMIADFYVTFKDKLKITVHAAECLYVGIVLDSGRFRFRGTTEQTMKLAGMLLGMGIDLEKIYANLMTVDFEFIKFRAYLTSKIKLTENGVAYLHISNNMRKRHGMTQEDASNIITLLSNIKGSLIWLLFIENDDKTVRVRLRSRFVEIEPLASRYHGGGHACASGATVYSEEEAKSLIAEADALLSDFKKSHPGLI